ncbi:MAG: 4Fe-4S ferredoxin, partial [Gemmatimonadota bacterium]
MKTLICNCNRTMPLDAAALSQALTKTAGTSSAGLDSVHTLLCRREAGAFLREAAETAARGDTLLVACTQESRLFTQLDAETRESAPRTHPIRFVNIRETGGWSRDARSATPKLVALIAAAQLPSPAPVATVSYRSGGRCLVIGTSEAAEHAAGMLSDRLDVTLLVERAGGALGQVREHAVHSGHLVHLSG